MRRGELASATEAAWFAGVPRQTAARWAREAGIDIAAARLRRLMQMRRKVQMLADGKAPRRPSKRQQRAMVKRKTAEWLEQGHAIKRDTRDVEPEAVSTD